MAARPSIVATVALCVLAGAGWPVSASQTTAGEPQSLAIASMAGSDLFASYCASCHGRSGTGDGPTAPALATPMPDLTTLARRSGGTFPADRVRAVVTHGAALQPPAHGSRDMPVWGPILSALDPDPVRTRVRIDAIVEYLRSLQVR